MAKEDNDGVGIDGLPAPVTWKGYDLPNEDNMTVSYESKFSRLVAKLKNLIKR